MTDLELIKAIKEKNHEESFLQLAKKHSGICYYISGKYLSPNQTFSRLLLRDFLQSRNTFIYQAALSYDPSKNVAFSTYLGNQIKYHCLNSLNAKTNKIKHETFESEFAQKLEEGRTEDDELAKLSMDMDVLFSLLNELKDKRIKEVVFLRYFGESLKARTWLFIGKKLNISNEWARKLHTQGIEFLRKKLKKGLTF